MVARVSSYSQSRTRGVIAHAPHMHVSLTVESVRSAQVLHSGHRDGILRSRAQPSEPNLRADRARHGWKFVPLYWV